jgi:carbonic anhydrase
MLEDPEDVPEPTTGYYGMPSFSYGPEQEDVIVQMTDHGPTLVFSDDTNNRVTLGSRTWQIVNFHIHAPR